MVLKGVSKLAKAQRTKEELEIITNMGKMVPDLGFQYYNVNFEGMEDFELMRRAQMNQTNVKFQGPTGSGKTTLAEAYCEKTNQPHFVMNMKGSTTSEELIGAYVPNTDKDGATYVWKDGIIVRAIKYSQMWREAKVVRTTTGKGKSATVTHEFANDDSNWRVDVGRDGNIAEDDVISKRKDSAKSSKDVVVENLTVKEWPLVMLTIEEINFSPEELMSVFFSLLDARRNVVLNEKNGEVLEAGKFLSINATMNPDYIGTNQLNAALNDRFLIKLNVEYCVKTENKLISERAKKYGLSMEDVVTLKAFVKNVRNGIQGEGCQSNISTRMIASYLDIKGIFGDGVAKESILNAVDPEDREFVAESYERAATENEEITLDDAEMEGLDLSTFKGYVPPAKDKKETRKKKVDKTLSSECPF